MAKTFIPAAPDWVIYDRSHGKEPRCAIAGWLFDDETLRAVPMVAHTDHLQPAGTLFDFPFRIGERAVPVEMTVEVDD